MQIVKPSASFMFPVDGEEILRRLELIGRVCYKSEDRITEGSAHKFVAMLVHQLHHESVIEHCSVTVKLVVDRGVSHEIVRHRIASYSQESTRYCDYGKHARGITVIDPMPFESFGKRLLWRASVQVSDWAYRGLRWLGLSAQIARSVLPNSLKTELIMTANLREWRHFFILRTAQAAHPQMREVTIPLLAEFKRTIPVVFDDIEL